MNRLSVGLHTARRKKCLSPRVPLPTIECAHLVVITTIEVCEVQECKDAREAVVITTIVGMHM